MRYFFTVFMVSALSFLISGCNNDINLYKGGEATPVVYCLLNPQTDVQYVRLGKSFVSLGEPEKTELSADSLLWIYEPEVYIERWENDDPVEIFVFNPVDITARDTGLFPRSGLKLYESDFKPLPGSEYHLYVFFPDIDKIVSGETIIMDIPEVLDPENVPGRTVSFDTISPLRLRWKSGDHSGLYQGVFKMNYSETSNNNFEIKSSLFSTDLVYKQTPDDMYEETVNSRNFFIAVGNEIEEKQGVSREIINFEFIFYSSGPELAILVGSELGISNPFALIRNTSNITGGIGVLSSFTIQRIPNLVPSNTTKYFMATGEHTKHLGFNPD